VFPDWLKKKIPAGYDADTLSGLAARRLNTVCQSARCPNLAECFHRGTATFMILGRTCTRGCRYCGVGSAGKSADHPPPEAVDPDEPRRVAEAAAWLKLRHVVLTSVTRDDLPDGGAEHWARVVRAVRQALPESRIEVLTPDFGGDTAAVARVLDAEPDVFNHNLETVPRLFPALRPAGDPRCSLDVLAFAHAHRPDIVTKSGIMVGLGETPEEVETLLAQLRRAQVSILTVGQYLPPSPRHFPVSEYVRPEIFERYRARAESLGFTSIASGPFVRSSYQAEEAFAAQDGGADKGGCARPV
jgi:lipoic acid synthetase